jgi:lysophospholipase L1-like esterase
MLPARFRLGVAWGTVAVALLASPAFGQSATFVSGPSASDLNCPTEGMHAPHPGGPRIPEPFGGTDMPTAEQLGLLSRTIIRDAPAIDPAKIPEFALRDGTANRPRRIAVWGDSHVAAGPFMPTVAEAIRSNGITVGSHFLPPTMGRANVRLPTLHAYCIGHGWNTDLAFKAAGAIETGPALANRSAVAGPESYLWLDLRNAERQATLRQIRIVYRPAGATEIAFSVNDGPEQRATLAGSGASETLALSGDALIATFKLRVTQGELVLQGFILDYDQPPLVTFDVFGLPSATAHGWANADPAALTQALHGDSYDAVVLEYGTNEGNTVRFDADKYAADLTRTLTNMRAVFPKASCVLVGPPDRGVLLSRGQAPPDFLTFSRVHQQIEMAQAQIGAQFNCAAWNWQDLMGGPGGAYGWAYAIPQLAGNDLTHLTPAGYRRTGQALAKSLGWTGPFPP